MKILTYPSSDLLIDASLISHSNIGFLLRRSVHFTTAEGTPTRRTWPINRNQILPSVQLSEIPIRGKPFDYSFNGISMYMVCLKLEGQMGRAATSRA